jgi:hypothetical protein
VYGFFMFRSTFPVVSRPPTLYVSIHAFSGPPSSLSRGVENVTAAFSHA